jgi:putative transcription factor
MHVQDWKQVVFRKRNMVVPISDNSTHALALKEKVHKNNESRNESVNLKKVASETENFHHNTISKDEGKSIIQARVAKKLTQEQLANALNIPVRTISDIERGSALYNGSLLARIKRFLGSGIADKI